MALELKDKTANQNDITTNNSVDESVDAPASLTGSTISALFDNSGDYLEALDSTSLDTTGNLTIEFWMKNSSTDGSFQVAKYLDSTNKSYSYYGDSAELATFINSADGSNTGYGNTTTGVIATDGAWHHYAITYTASGPTLVFYKDGSSTGTWSYTSLKTSIYSGTANLKMSHAGTGTFRICDVRIWNTARSAAEISSNYTSFLTGNESGLVANWTFQPFSRAGGSFLLNFV